MDTTLNTMLTLRDDIIAKENTEFHKSLDTIMRREIANIKYELLREKLIDSVRKNPTAQSASIEITLDIDDLFTERYTWVNKELVRNENVLSFIFRDSAGKLQKYVLDKENQDSRKAFDEYIYTAEPNLQRLRAILLEWFPLAKRISPWMFIHHGSKSTIRINITYELSAIKDLESVGKPVYDTPGGFVLWK